MDLLLELLMWLVLSLTGGADQQSRGERRDRLMAKRRQLALRRWLKKGDRRGPLPSVGIVCPDCEYRLAGLTGGNCPECGEAIDFQRISAIEADKSASLRRK